MQSTQQHRNVESSVKRLTLILPTTMAAVTPIDCLELLGPLGVNPELVCEFVLFNWDGIDRSFESASPVMNTFAEMIECLHSAGIDEDEKPSNDVDAYFHSNTPEIFSELLRIKKALEPYLGDIPSELDGGSVEQMLIQSVDLVDHYSPLMVEVFVTEGR